VHYFIGLEGDLIGKSALFGMFGLSCGFEALQKEAF
jgi:hypothetical protein